MKKEAYVPKYKEGDYIITGRLILYIQQVKLVYGDGRYFFKIIYPKQQDGVEVLDHFCDDFDRHLLTIKGNAAIIKMLYE